jgi:hypothetical protein
MSGVLHKHTLEETLPRATTVVIAAPADPPVRHIEISIAPDGGPPSDEFPPYHKCLRRYRVEEVLHGRATVGAVIEVGTTSGATLGAHRLYHVEKVSKILRHDRYVSSLTEEDRKSDARRILLLMKLEPDAWIFAVDGSEEPLRMRPRIEELLAKRKRRKAKA